MKKIDKLKFSDMRSKAEKAISEIGYTRENGYSEFGANKLIHELEVHEIELRMQNEELITARLEAEKAVDKYTELYDFAPTAYVSLSNKSSIQKLNITCSQMLGRERLYLLNKPFNYYVSDDSKSLLNEFLYNVFEKEPKQTCEIRIINDIHQTFYIRIIGVLSEDKSCCNATLVDYTAEKIASQELKASVNFKNMILEAAGEGIVGISRNGSHLFANSMAKELLGYTDEELIGQKSHALYHHHPGCTNLSAYYECPIESTLHSGKPFHGEEIFRRKDGTFFYVELASLPIYDDFIIIGAVVTFRDITQRKEREESLRFSEERYKALFKTNLTISFLVEPSAGIIKDANPAACKFYGWTHEELCGMKISDINTLPHAEILKEMDLAKREKRNYFIFKHRKASGEIADVEVYSVPIEFKDSSLLYSMIHDITDRKKAEAELLSIHKQIKESEAELKKSQSIARLGSWKWSSKTNLVEWSDEMFEVFGIGREEFTGIPGDAIKNIIHPDDLSRMYKFGEELGIKRMRFDFRIIMADKSVRYISSESGEITYDNDGTVLFVNGICQDITKKKRSDLVIEARLRLVEFALTHSRKELQIELLAELEKLTGSQIGFFHIIDEDQVNLKLQSWSSNTTKLCNIVLNKEHHNVDEAGVWIECLLQKKPVFHNDYKDLPNASELPPGHPNIERELLIPVIRNNLVVAIVGIGNKPIHYDEDDVTIASLLCDFAWDLTERKGAEENLYKLNADLEARVRDRTSQLIAINKDLESFAYSVSHDLRAPLRHISSFVELLKELNNPGRSSEELNYLDIISNGAKEMSKMIDALLSSAKLQGNELVRTRIQTTELVNSVAEFLCENTAGRKINFKIEKMPDCMGDEQLIRLVWSNLISNAIKFTEKREVAEIEINSTLTDSKVEFCVRDNGAGFDMKYAAKLFGVFQRLHKQRDFEGVGIGLSNVASIITRHGGKFRAEGEEDKGASFYFSLPD